MQIESVLCTAMMRSTDGRNVKSASKPAIDDPANRPSSEVNPYCSDSLTLRVEPPALIHSSKALSSYLTCLPILTVGRSLIRLISYTRAGLTRRIAATSKAVSNRMTYLQGTSLRPSTIYQAHEVSNATVF